MRQNIDVVKRTTQKRILLLESEILVLKDRIKMGVTLNKAVRLLVPHSNYVTIGKLLKWHTEMEEALSQEDFVLHETIRNSLFPYWVVNRAQPYSAVYYGNYPYGFWSYE